MLKVILFCLWSWSVFSSDRHFVLVVYDKKIKVTSPTSTLGNYVIVMENKTLNKILAKIVSGLGSTNEYFVILPSKQAS